MEGQKTLLQLQQPRQRPQRSPTWMAAVQGRQEPLVRVQVH